MLTRPPHSRAVSPTAWGCFLAILSTACGPEPATPTPAIAAQASAPGSVAEFDFFEIAAPKPALLGGSS